MEQEEKLYNDMETARWVTYLGDMVNAHGGCQDAVTVRM